jgi:hypothetical protein
LTTPDRDLRPTRRSRVEANARASSPMQPARERSERGPFSISGRAGAAACWSPRAVAVGVVQAGGRHTRPPSRSTAIDVQLVGSGPPKKLTMSLGWLTITAGSWSRTPTPPRSCDRMLAFSHTGPARACSAENLRRQLRGYRLRTTSTVHFPQPLIRASILLAVLDLDLANVPVLRLRHCSRLLLMAPIRLVPDPLDARRRCRPLLLSFLFTLRSSERSPVPVCPTPGCSLPIRCAGFFLQVPSM